MNPILEYNEKIKNKETIVSKKVSKIYQYLSEIITGKIESNYYYDEVRANHAILFIERYCKQTQFNRAYSCARGYAMRA